MEISLLHLWKSDLDRDAPFDTAKENYKMALVQHDTLSNSMEVFQINNRIAGGITGLEVECNSLHTSFLKLMGSPVWVTTVTTINCRLWEPGLMFSHQQRRGTGRGEGAATKPPPCIKARTMAWLKLTHHPHADGV